MRIRPDRRVATAIALTALLAVTGGAAVALAANQIKGATYKGKLSLSHASNTTFSIRFKVSANGKRVGDFALANGYPIYCQGGGFGAVQSASGTITREGTFKVKLPLYFAPAHQRQGFVIITGSFAKHGNESGKVMTDFIHAGTCNGTASYTAKG
jgi:hypothetical protein